MEWNNISMYWKRREQKLQMTHSPSSKVSGQEGKEKKGGWFEMKEKEICIWGKKRSELVEAVEWISRDSVPELCEEKKKKKKKVEEKAGQATSPLPVHRSKTHRRTTAAPSSPDFKQTDHSHTLPSFCSGISFQSQRIHATFPGIKACRGVVEWVVVGVLVEKANIAASSL
jgi:hypothetical protein